MATKQKILIVDDDNNIAELISLYLTKECYDTKIVNDGEAALVSYEHYNPISGMPRNPYQVKCSDHHALGKGRDL